VIGAAIMVAKIATGVGSVRVGSYEKSDCRCQHVFDQEDVAGITPP